jgi:hypothetical protein
MPHCEAPIPAHSEPLPRVGLRVYRREVSVQGLPTRTPAWAAACSCVAMVSATATAGISVSSSSRRRVSAICGLHTPYFLGVGRQDPCALENFPPEGDFASKAEKARDRARRSPVSADCGPVRARGRLPGSQGSKRVGISSARSSSRSGSPSLLMRISSTSCASSPASSPRSPSRFARSTRPRESRVWGTGYPPSRRGCRTLVSLKYGQVGTWRRTRS